MLLFASALVPGAASATQTARITARFGPEHLGVVRAISFEFNLEGDGHVSSPVQSVQLDYPGNLGFATSGLGVAACRQRTLELTGPRACPRDSVMGHGSAVAEIPIGPELIHEHISLTVLAGPSTDGYLHMLIYADGKTPVTAQNIITGILLPGRLNITIPPIPSLPGTPYVTITHMTITLGGALTYYEHRHGRTVAYRPAGVSLPALCPRGGFPFGASFSFMDGTRTAAATAAACPTRHPAVRH